LKMQEKNQTDPIRGKTDPIRGKTFGFHFGSRRDFVIHLKI